MLLTELWIEPVLAVSVISSKVWDNSPADVSMPHAGLWLVILPGTKSVERKRKSCTKKKRSASFEIAHPECWQLNAGGYIGAFVCLFRTELHILPNIVPIWLLNSILWCCFFSQKMVPFTGREWSLFSRMCQLKNHPIRVSLRGARARVRERSINPVLIFTFSIFPI